MEQDPKRRPRLPPGVEGSLVPSPPSPPPLPEPAPRGSAQIEKETLTDNGRQKQKSRVTANSLRVAALDRLRSLGFGQLPR